MKGLLLSISQKKEAESPKQIWLLSTPKLGNSIKSGEEMLTLSETIVPKASVTKTMYSPGAKFDKVRSDSELS